MTQKERARLQVLNSLLAEHMTLDQAATLMGVTPRHTRRILAAYREEGAAAVAHGHRGREPANATPDAVVASVVRLARTRYEGVNHTHLSELLSERDGIDIGRTTLRRILLDAGLSSPRRRRPPKHRYMIERRASGTTVQETPTSPAASPCGRARLALGRAHPPTVAAETLSDGGDRQHELRPSPAGRSVILTARTPSHRCRRPPHRPNHHRASPAAVCAAIPSVAPQRSPRGRRDRGTRRGPALWAVAGGHGQSESPSSVAPRSGLRSGLALPG